MGTDGRIRDGGNIFYVYSVSNVTEAPQRNININNPCIIDNPMNVNNQILSPAFIKVFVMTIPQLMSKRGMPFCV